MHLNYKMVGEKFGIYSSQLAKKNLNYPPWLEKILEFTHIEWLKMHLSCQPSMVGENFGIYSSPLAK